MTNCLLFNMINLVMKINIKLNTKDRRNKNDYLKDFKGFVDEQFKELFKRKLKFPITAYHL